MRSMYDVLYLPDPAPAGFDVAAGYVPSQGISHPWSPQDWQRARAGARWLLPIAGCWTPFGDGARDAARAITQAPAGLPRDVAFALDVEEGVAAEAHLCGYVDAWALTMQLGGFVPVIYCSGSTAHLFARWALWVAHWTGQPHLEAGSVATQWTSPSFDPALQVDISSVADSLPLWDTRPAAPPAPTIPEMERVILTPQGGGATAIEQEPGRFVKVAHQATVNAYSAAGWKACLIPNDDYARIVGSAP